MATGGGKGSKKKAPAKGRTSSKSSRSRARKPAASKKSAGSAGSTALSGSLSPALAAAAIIPPAPVGPTPTLILDTGGWTVKHGLVTVTPPPPPDLVTASVAGNTAPHAVAARHLSPPPPSSDDSRRRRREPRQSPNATARPHHQLTVLSADEIRSVRNQSQLVFNRPLERGYTVDLGAQLRVWRRVCDVEGVDAVPSPAGGPLDPAVAALLGIGPAAAAAKKKRRAGAAGVGALPSMSPPPPTCVSRDCAVIMLTQPFTPRAVSDRIDEMWFRDLGFARVGKRLVQTMAAFRYLSALKRERRRAEAGAEGGDDSDPNANQHGTDEAEECGDIPPWVDDQTECCLVIDSGFSLTHVVPTVSARAVSRGVRRLNIGGKFLTNLLKEAVSYRQWNMMDEFHIVNEAKEALCYVSANFNGEVKGAAAVRPGWREFDRDFVLPDFAESFEGTVRLPGPLQRKKEMEEAAKEAKREAKEAAAKKERRQDSKEGDGNDAKTEKEVKGDEEDARTEASAEENGVGGRDAVDAAVDSDDETDDQRRARILRQREEERQHREAEEAERQVLSLSVERFAIPEALFRPTDVGLEQGGIAEAAIQAVEACDPNLRAAMLRNVVVMGGNARMPGLGRRLEEEMRRLSPSGYEIRTWTPGDPVGYAWRGAREFASSAGEDAFRTCSVDRVEWEASRRSSTSKDLLNIWAKLEEQHAADGMMIM